MENMFKFWIQRASAQGYTFYWCPRRMTLKPLPGIYRWFHWNFGFTKLDDNKKQPEYTVKRK